MCLHTQDGCYLVRMPTHCESLIFQCVAIYFAVLFERVLGCFSAHSSVKSRRLTSSAKYTE